MDAVVQFGRDNQRHTKTFDLIQRCPPRAALLVVTIRSVREAAPLGQVYGVLVMAWRQFPQKVVKHDIRTTDASKENQEAYRKLLALWGLALCSDGIKAFVLAQLRITGLWGLSGHTKFVEFCEQVLRMPKTTANRAIAAGSVALEFAGLKSSHFIKLLESSDLTHFESAIIETTADSKLPVHHQTVVSDRKIQNSLVKVKYDRRKEVVDAAAKSGDLTPKGVARVAKELKAEAAKPSKKPKPKKKSEPLLDIGDTYREKVTALGTKLIQAGKAKDAAIAEHGLSILNDAFHAIRELTKLIHGWEPSKSTVPF